MTRSVNDMLNVCGPDHSLAGFLLCSQTFKDQTLVKSSVPYLTVLSQCQARQGNHSRAARKSV